MSDVEDVPLFGGYEPPEVEPEESLSSGRRLTRRQQQDVSNGKHPLTGGPLHPDATTRRHAPIAGHDDCHPEAPCSGASDPFTCGSCVFREAGHRYPKCVLPNPASGKPWATRVSHSARSDVRAWWPACVDYQPTDPEHVLDVSHYPPVCRCGERFEGAWWVIRQAHAEHTIAAQR